MNKLTEELLLRPLAAIYGGVVALRNKLYDLEVCRSRRTKIRSISVGNITVGGTGKTPHAEYIIELLKDNHKVAYLSRGYKRKSKGFVLAKADTPWQKIGDEAFQIKTKYPDILTVVDANRHHAIEKIARLHPDTEVVLLDDAYQHRAISPDLSILLMDYNRPIYEDRMLPYGRLREAADNTFRADIIIITKCPDSLTDAEMLSVRTSLSPFPYQQLYFTSIGYKKPMPCFSSQISDTNAVVTQNCNAEDGRRQESDLMGFDLLAVSGIASPAPFYDHLNSFANSVKTISYPDHHAFTQKDIADIAKEFTTIASHKKAIVVTEKDFVRLASMTLPDALRDNLWYVGIKIEFLRHDSTKFDSQIKSFIAKNRT